MEQEQENNQGKEQQRSSRSLASQGTSTKGSTCWAASAWSAATAGAWLAPGAWIAARAAGAWLATVGAWLAAEASALPPSVRPAPSAPMGVRCLEVARRSHSSVNHERLQHALNASTLQVLHHHRRPLLVDDPPHSDQQPCPRVSCPPSLGGGLCPPSLSAPRAFRTRSTCSTDMIEQVAEGKISFHSMPYALHVTFFWGASFPIHTA
jgi:hypothetical protein